MKHRTFNEVERAAEIQPAPPVVSAEEIRRRRLLQLAEVLEHHEGQVRLLSGIEYYPVERRHDCREDNSPLSIAFSNPEFRREGLASDRFGDVMEFFDLSSGEAHHLFCDCHYPGRVSAQMIAHRVRSAARHSILRSVIEAVTGWFRTHPF
jgi:hypothetical protein